MINDFYLQDLLLALLIKTFLEMNSLTVAVVEKHSTFSVVFKEIIQNESMNKHPLNLALRFLLEIAALAAFAVWGWKAASGWWGILLAIGLPVFFATVWGVFAVKNDPSRSGKTVIPTNGVVRLILEILFFGLAALALFDLGFNIAGLAISVLVPIHYVSSYDRVIWMLK